MFCRCEGGTNLVAMEAMAAGVPSILSNNTGHGDLVNAGCSQGTHKTNWACVPLRRQKLLVPEASSQQMNPYEDWGESDIAECVEKLKILWRNETLRLRVGQNGAALIASSMTWELYRAKLASALKAC
jgi:glycosyltransferase involved in cell wall biosynthesis